MASDYGLNFGFLRSSEEVRVAEGRFRVPAAASWLLGTPVEPDASAPGYLKQSAANAAPITGYAGLLLQELEWLRSIYESDPTLMDSYMYGAAKPAHLGIITNGAGTKVWFRNTASSTRADGRVISARTMFASAGVALGTVLGWSGTAWVVLAGTSGAGGGSAGVTNGWMKVTDYNSSTARVEAVLIA